ncbi:MAG: 4-(cytidine 5'-diphospho)-2-C-methyl-D-erythritol kinase [Gammaproteobacteria bacterium]|nr:4-(cytidine 5'-diphospho)-2-C-methyl-D-erythritol kinase [Gammaproteobacteria bacterium]
MKTQLTLPSPAKLNLFLHINGRLPNGYHELQTLFHFLDYGDELSFALQENDSIDLTCNIKELEDKDNLIIKAINALKRYLDDDFPYRGLKIHLHKVLPMGGGVGGGSSNAATTLLALNVLWQLNLPQQQLIDIGNKLGADVPIFIKGQSAIAEGTGEIFTPYQVPEKYYLVLTPSTHVNTALLFSSEDLPRNTAKLDNDSIVYQGITPDFCNDFETLVYKRYPAVAKALDWLLEYAPARMTGTGACVFAEFENEKQAQEVYNLLPVELSGFVAKGSNISSTHLKLNELIR